MLVSFDNKFIRLSQKLVRLLGSQINFWSSLINMISKNTYVVFYLSCIFRRFNGKKIAKQMKSIILHNRDVFLIFFNVKIESPH